MRNKIKHRQKMQDREISDTPSGVGDFPVLHSASLVSKRLKSYPRVSEISLSCTVAGVRFYMSITVIYHAMSLGMLYQYY